MKNIYPIIVLCLLFLSCNNEKKEYYANGTIKKSFKLSNDKYEGEYKEYYQSGNLKLIYQFLKGQKIDSSIYYKDTKEGKIDKVVHYLNDSIQHNLFYNNERELILEGESIRDSYRIGKWRFHRKEYDSIVEYKNINSTTYVNQVWLIDKNNKDTLGLNSNYFSVFCGDKDTLALNDVLKISITLVEPYYSYDTDMEVLIPKNDKELKGDFSNISEIKLDTLRSLKNDGISNIDIPDDVPVNHIVEFGMKYEESGKKNIRGVITEYYINNLKQKIERKLFFEKEIVVVDSTDNGLN